MESVERLPTAGEYSHLSMAAITRFRSRGATELWPLITRETVEIDTPASLATLRIEAIETLVGFVDYPMEIDAAPRGNCFIN
jgi:hypothetical protein